MEPGGTHGAAAEKRPPDNNGDCVVCFEALETKGGAIPLPCDCRVPYCADCWDRSLAASISACGRALCPSCRGPMRVDFDASSGRLAFTRAEASELDADTPDASWRRRLYEQAKPKQIQLLQKYGAKQPAPARYQAGAGAEPAVHSGNAQASNAQVSSAVEASITVAADVAVEPARCVCGCALAEVSVRDRVLTFVQEESPVTPPRSVIKRLMRSPPIVCDICCNRVQPASKVWTCENGRRTMLHAAAYDVCESCFVFHAWGKDAPSGEEEYESDGEECEEDYDFYDGHYLPSDEEASD